MKRNFLQTIVLLSALALASCSTTNKIASTQTTDDDVYFTKAEAGDAPVYRQPVSEDRYIASNGNEGDDEDYYYYDSYSSRINRFGYNTPFDYYDDYYYGYNTPSYAYGGYGGGLGYGGLGYGYGGWNLGLGLGYGGYGYGGYGGYGYGGYGLGLGYGYGLGGYYSPYSYWGTGYGYGGGYWGVVSANNSSRARPYRGSGIPVSAYNGNRNSPGRPVGYNGNYPNAMSYPGRSSRPGASGAINGNYGSRPSRGGYNNGNSEPTYRPTRSEASRQAPQPIFDRGSSSNSSGGGSVGGGGGGSRGGGRPSRP